MIYRDLILPHLVHKACSQRHLMKQRRKVVPLAAGRFFCRFPVSPWAQPG